MSAHNHTLSTSSSEVPPASPEAASPTIPMSDTIVSRRTFPLFAIALTIVGTMPIGIGVGLACRAKSIVPAEPATDSMHDEVSAIDDTASVSWAWRNQQNADDLFRAGDFRLALQLYQSKECEDSLHPYSALSLKIALCHEALGQWDEALAILDRFTKHSDLDLCAAALLAQSRIWLHRHELSKARMVLGQLLCRTVEPGRDCPSEIAEDSGFLLAIACLLDDGTSHDSTDPTRPVSPLHSFVWQRSEVRYLDRLTAPQSSLSLKPTESHVATLVATALGTDAQELVIQLLTATSADQRRRIAEEFAQRLLTSHSAHWLAGHVKLALGEVAYQRGDLAEAAVRYGEASGRSSTALSVIAAYNQGVVQFRLHEYRNASLALGRFIDGAPGHELCPRALILRGRSLLELGDGELAAFDLKRAADLPGRDEERAWATVFLGMANLQARKPKVSAQEMFQRRDRLQSEVARSEMAFMVSLARMESLKSPDSRDRESLFLLRALATVDPNAEWLGACGRLLIGRAYQHLGLVDQAAEIYEQALQQEVQEPFASEMKLAVADYALLTGDHPRGLNCLAELQANQKAPWATQAGLRIAKWELSQGHHHKCLALCRELLHSETEHASILRLMGEAHELAGEFDQAAECFAGLANP